MEDEDKALQAPIVETGPPKETGGTWLIILCLFLGIGGWMGGVDALYEKFSDRPWCETFCASHGGSVASIRGESKHLDRIHCRCAGGQETVKTTSDGRFFPLTFPGTFVGALVGAAFGMFVVQLTGRLRRQLTGNRDEL